MFNQSLVRLRAGTKTDRGGNEVKDWSTPDRLLVTGLNIQPSIQRETTDEQRNATVTGWHVQSAEGTNPDIRFDDRIVWDGMTLEVDGEVARWPEPFSDRVHHIEFEMKRATG
ncbi:hypothetical protein ACH49_24340 [Streptomyces leeuwenhoekii]|uniref:Head-to-tail stopper n=1 Tax=Streptomyces leeuwenhoekii TaxID=1437453 RepID=A0ABR5HTN9_STRLW|nr:hypothetical protein [Streptomyces leeuwenhoekii]KMS71758.1 hypothetical protein ACH49_24340 [Streptomyces leeuwenhoekii]